MAKEGPDWQGLLKWSLAQSDGTQPPRNLSDEDRKWFMEAMQGQTVDIIKRMKEITVVMQIPEEVLESQGVTTSDVEGMLEELQEHVESIDMANDLHSIGGLVPLLGYLKSSHAGIRARAAEVVTTIVQNNPKGQQLVMEANGIEPLFQNFTSDPDVNARTKALGAISSLIRHNKPGIAAFRLANGYASLKDALSSDSVQFQRKALRLLEYLLRENSSDVKVVTELGFARIFMHLASSEDGEIREAALGGLLELVKDRTGEPSSSSSALGEDSGKMKQVLEERIKGISEMNTDDLLAVKGERQLVDLLWSVCYDEPSSLRDKGLLSIPEDDAPAPDVVGNLFEPPLRSHAPRVASNEMDTSVEEKKPPLLLGLGSPNPSS